MRLKDFIFIIVFTLIFSFLIFITKNYFFGGKEALKNKIIEENYIEPVVIIYDDKILNEGIVEQEEVEMSSATNIRYTYVPRSFGFEDLSLEYKDIFDSFLSYEPIDKNIILLDVMFYKRKGEVRGRMQNQKVRLYGIYDLYVPEFLAVGIHEFAHFFDLYVLERKNGIDISYYFYDVSWEDTLIMKGNQSQKDFVSGYSMTNKYEDFAETYTYYVLHNSDFKEKAEKSSILKQKYDFFDKYVFNNEEFKNEKYKIEKIVKDYYRDITKIDFSLQNFLQYLKN